MISHTYEMIPYDSTNYLFSVGQLTYVAPHIHRELELGMVLEGEIHYIANGTEYHLFPGDLWLMNPCQCHELYSASEHHKAIFLELQVSTSFFKQYFQKIENIRIDTSIIEKDGSEPNPYFTLTSNLVASAKNYFGCIPYFELKCAGDINHLFAFLLQTLPFTLLTEGELRQNDLRMNRMQRITDYIEEHISEKLLLSELASQENLTLNYLSHFFKENFGMPFQTYVQHIRCRKAANMLLETNCSPSDISLQCGFSALKYMNQGFEELFGCKPAVYRAHAQKAPENLSKIKPAMNKGSSKPNQPLANKPRETLCPHLSNTAALNYLYQILN